MGKLAVLAIGGNSLIKDEQYQSIEDQYKAVCETVVHIADIIADGHDVIITHGNGPQVGFILRRSEIAQEAANMHHVPLVSCVADTQGSIGYQIQQALDNEFKKRGMNKRAVTVVTQVEVDEDDPSFQRPSKPIGGFYTGEQMERLKEQYPQWVFVNDAGRGYRRVVPSPLPKGIIEQQEIEFLVKGGFCVIAAGGGGIPVLRDVRGMMTGVDAVIDKDHASALLAAQLKADMFIISTAVEKVYVNYGKPDARPLDQLTVAEAKSLMAEGQFAPGSMLPKVEAILKFLENGGQEGIITCPEHLCRAMKGETGTRIIL